MMARCPTGREWVTVHPVPSLLFIALKSSALSVSWGFFILRAQLSTKPKNLISDSVSRCRLFGLHDSQYQSRILKCSLYFAVRFKHPHRHCSSGQSSYCLSAVKLPLPPISSQLQFPERRTTPVNFFPRRMADNSSSDPVDSYSPVYLTARVIVSFGCVLANSIVIYLIATTPRLRSRSNWFVFSLALADFSVGLFLTPIDVFLAYYQEPAPRTVQDTLDVVYDYIIDVSAMAVCALISDRYLAITKPLRYTSFMTKRRVLMIVVQTWLLPAVLGLPVIAFFFQEEDLFEEELAYKTALVFLFQLLPSVAMFLCFAHILFIVRQHSKRTAVQMEQLSYNQQAAAERAVPNQPRVVLRHIVAKLVGSLCVFFVLCNVVSVFKTICFAFDLLEIPLVVDRVSLFMINFNSLANPGVYALLNQDIRSAVNSLFGARASWMEHAWLVQRKWCPCSYIRNITCSFCV